MTRTLSRLAALALVLAALGGTPAAADPPPGSQAELIFSQESSSTTPLTSGTFTRFVYVNDISGDPSPIVAGCLETDQVGFAFTPASANPGAAGSPERPAVASGDTIADLFEYTTGGYFGDTTYLNLNPRNMVTSRSDGTSRLLDERWPAGTRLSAVAVCYTGNGDEPDEQTVVAGPGGFALSSWIQFVTVASPTVPTKTSAGFEVAGAVILEKTTTALTGTSDVAAATLTASVRDQAGAVLPGLTGRVDFHVPADEAATVSAPVGAGGDSSVTVDLPPAGTDVVYVAEYVPDAAASGSFEGSTSRRYAVLGPDLQVSAELTLTAPDVAYGENVSATVTVRRGSGPAAGPVSVSLDGQPLQAPLLASGRVSVRLPALLAPGAHVVEAAYAGDATTGSSRATRTVTVSRLASTLAVTPVEIGKKATLSATVTCDSSAVEPTGTVEVRLGGTVLARASLSSAVDGAVSLVAKLPKVKAKKAKKAKKKKAVLTVSYAGATGIAAAPDQSITVKLPRKAGKHK